MGSFALSVPSLLDSEQHFVIENIRAFLVLYLVHNYGSNNTAGAQIGSGEGSPCALWLFALVKKHVYVQLCQK